MMEDAEDEEEADGKVGIFSAGELQRRDEEEVPESPEAFEKGLAENGWGIFDLTAPEKDVNTEARGRIKAYDFGGRRISMATPLK